MVEEKDFVTRAEAEAIAVRAAAAAIARQPAAPDARAQYVTRAEAEEIARRAAHDAIPPSLRGLDVDTGETDGLTSPGAYPEVLRLGQASDDGTGTVVPPVAYWGTLPASGLTARGDKVLYMGVFLREYDEDGVIVAPGSEIERRNYATQAEYEAALAEAKHTLRPTWDVARWVTTYED